MDVFGAYLEALRHCLSYGSKRHYQNRKEVIPYQACVYIEIYCNHNKPIHCNVRFEGGILILWCYGVPIRTRIQYEIHTTRLYNTPIKHRNRKLSVKEKLAFIEVIKIGTYIRIRLGFGLY